jgi:AraC-like DNA-binding protein
MQLIDASLYLTGWTLYLVMAIILIAINPFYLIKDTTYQRAKLLLSISAILEAVILVVIWCCIMNNKDFLFWNDFLSPVIYYIQILLMGYAMLGILHSERLVHTRWLFYSTPIAILTLIYIIAYRVQCYDNVFSYSNYESFTRTPLARHLSTAAFVLIALLLIQSIVVLTHEIKIYHKRLNNFYSGDIVVSAYKVGMIVNAFIAFLVLSALDLIFTDEKTGPIFTLLSSILFAIFSVFIINAGYIHYEVSSISEEPESTPEKEESKSEASNEETELSIRHIIQEWTQREDKPYLRESLSIKEVADEMNMSPRLLSEYINNIYNINYNTWINSLRIKEVMRLLQDKPEMSLSQIATETGFGDQSILGKSFKRIVGKTPSAFRKGC